MGNGNKNVLSISDELIIRAQKYIEEGRFKDISEFINKAIELLLYAEDRKEEFANVIHFQGKENGENQEAAA
jgi:Arc/MetJ-type ribon-helix-helix transcriptional regulator